MTLKEALVLSLEVWRYLAKHPKIKRKWNLPKELYGKIKNMRSCCPLCEYLRNLFDCTQKCPLCFIKDGELKRCGSMLHPYTIWRDGEKETRKEGATAIVQLLKAALKKENRNEKSN
jgi:hypothetical protein